LWKSGGHISEHDKNRIVEFFNKRLTSRHKSPITAAWLFQDWKPRYPEEKHQSLPQPPAFPLAHVQHRGTDLQDTDLPDLLTPGSATTNISQLYNPHVGARLAKRLEERSADAILAVENGDFAAQGSIGARIAEDAAAFPSIRSVGLYLAGEGLRLSADLEANPSAKAALYQQALAKYRESSLLLPTDPRPVRGVARINEREELFDEATKGFEHAEGLVLVSKSKRGTPYRMPFLDHEHLRVVRHKIHCLFDLREHSPANVWNRVHKTEELYGLVVHCDNLHRELMEPFSSRQRWWQIEWFMGLVFLAKAWGYLKQHDRMLFCLIHALSFRRSMLANPSTLTNIERANLEWWTEVAFSSREMLTKHFTRRVEQLHAALLHLDYVSVLTTVDDLLLEFRSPGDKNT
jgi:hypothetical protein